MKVAGRDRAKIPKQPHLKVGNFEPETYEEKCGPWNQSMLSLDEYNNCRDGHDHFDNHNWISGKCTQCGLLQDAFGYYEIKDMLEKLHTDIVNLKVMVINRQEEYLESISNKKEDNKK